VDLQDVVLPSGLIVDMFTPYDVWNDWQLDDDLGTCHQTNTVEE